MLVIENAELKEKITDLENENKNVKKETKQYK